mgnify:CR=1 FL=1
MYDNCKAIDGFSSKTAYQPGIVTDNPEVTALMIDDDGKAISFASKDDANKVLDPSKKQGEAISKSQYKTCAVTDYEADCNSKKVVAYLSASASKVAKSTVTVNGKAAKSYKANGKILTANLSKKLKKGDKVVITIAGEGYNTVTKKITVKGVYKLSKVKAKKGAKKITGTVSAKKAKVQVKVGKKKYKKAIIGEIQEFAAERNDKSSKDNYSKLTDKDIPFYIVERYKSIRTNVNFSLATSDKKIFAVSSANPSEGKSIISANIAIALAQGGNKALLIDADMRKAVQHKIFEIKNKKGLSTAISKMNKLDECIQKNVMENLDVMTSGPLPPNPSELLASENMLAILDELNKKYQIIIIDTPPVNVVTDAMELAKCVSGIVVVLRYGRTTTEDIEAVVKKMDFSKVNMLGFILNGIKNKRSGRYYSKYKYDYKRGYGYYGEKTDINETKNEKK